MRPSSSPHQGRPIVAITATTRTTDRVERVRLNDAYVRAAEAAGAIPVIVPPLVNVGEAVRLLDAVDGLLLSGGEDVDPAHYGAPPHPALGPVTPRRDDTEIALAREAQRRRLPTLAICRGVQLVNVAFGGTLVQDLRSQRSTADEHDHDGPRDARVHGVSVDEDSRLHRVLGVPTLAVNSFHHQALDQLGDGLRVSARASDGTIEAVESRDREWWMVGVQWHPEELQQTPEAWDRDLLRAFVDACAAEPGDARGRDVPAPAQLSR
jgi:putative glutamine amidotransferase